MRWPLWVVATALAAGAAWAVRRLCSIAGIAAAYKAKVLCSAVFCSGRDIDPEHADEIAADSYWLLRPIRARVDRRACMVTASFKGLRRRIAIYRPGLGATLTSETDRLVLTAALAIEKPATPSTFRSSPFVERAGPAALQRVVESAFSEPNPERLRRTRAVVVVREGRIVAERYTSGFSKDTPLPGWSMTKSVLAALVGILVGNGRLSLADRELLPVWRSPDPRAAICLEDLLRMRSGLRFVENYSNPSSDVIQMLFNRYDAAAYAANCPLAAPPGTRWSYSSGTTNILSAVIRRVAGEADYQSWPRRVLFDPLGMESAVLEPDASGTFVCSSFMLATARDWARFGQLWLDDGIWDSQQFLAAGWVRFSTTPTPQSPEGNYGAHWWLKLNPEIGGATPAAARLPADAFFALGHEGQTLTVVPSLRLVVVRLGLSIYIDAWNHAAFLAELLEAL